MGPKSLTNKTNRKICSKSYKQIYIQKKRAEGLHFDTKIYFKYTKTTSKAKTVRLKDV